jgi:hypothetical protein
MAVRANWGENPDFAFSIGGFHPRFTPPANFPSLQRLMISMPGDISIALTAYFAITTNTLQLGAQVSVSGESDGFSIDGGFGFDALVIFSPFSFDVMIGAWLTIGLEGEDLASLSANLELTGPNPFHVEGKVKITILLVSVKIPIHQTFGEKQSENPITASPLTALIEQLQDPRNVHFVLPDWASADLVFTKDAETRLDPVGQIVISQHLVPLLTQLDKFGGVTPPVGETMLSFQAVDAQGKVLPSDSFNSEFAPAQFKDMSDDEKLSSPPFDDFPSGISLGGSYLEVKKEDCRSFAIEFESILHDKIQPGGVGEFKVVQNFVPKDEDSKRAMLGWSLTGSAKHYRPRRKVRDPLARNGVDVQRSTFCLGDVSKSIDGLFTTTSGSMTYTQARDALKANGTTEVVIMDSAFIAQAK